MIQRNTEQKATIWELNTFTPVTDMDSSIFESGQ